MHKYILKNIYIYTYIYFLNNIKINKVRRLRQRRGIKIRFFKR